MNWEEIIENEKQKTYYQNRIAERATICGISLWALFCCYRLLRSGLEISPL